MKTNACALVVCALTFFVFAGDEEVPEKGSEYVAKVSVLYDMKLGITTEIFVGGTSMIFRGVDLGFVELPYEEAVSKYTSKKEELSNLLSANSKLTPAVKAVCLSKWAQVTTSTLLDGLSAQDKLNRDYCNDLDDSIYDVKTRMNAFHEEQDKLRSSSTILAGAIANTRSELSTIRSELASQQAATSAELERVNTELQDLARVDEAVKTEAQREQERLDKEYAQKLAIIEQLQAKAKTVVQEMEGRLRKVEAAIESFVTADIFRENWRNASAWLGWKGSDGDQNKGVFIPTQKFTNFDEATASPIVEKYKIKDGQSIFTMLSDAGIVPVLTEKGVEEWKKRAGAKPRYYMLYKGDGDKRTLEAVNSGATTEHDAGLPAVMNWADQDTITVTGGVFVAKGDANVGATIEAFLNKHKSSGIKGELKGAAAKKTDDSLWSTNNVKNPANPSFDKSDRNNIWNLLAYCGDSDVSPKDAAEEGGSTKS